MLVMQVNITHIQQGYVFAAKLDILTTRKIFIIVISALEDLMCVR